MLLQILGQDAYGIERRGQLAERIGDLVVQRRVLRDDSLNVRERPFGLRERASRHFKGVLKARGERSDSLIDILRQLLNGRSITMLDVDANLYAVVDAPDTIDKAVDFVAEKYGATVPLADLLCTDSYDALTANTERGQYVGEVKLGKYRCSHLTFSGDEVDWQIWIEQGAEPLPRKLVIAYKHRPQHPKYTARIRLWDVSPRFREDDFQFQPPVDAERIDMIPIRSRWAN